MQEDDLFKVHISDDAAKIIHKIHRIVRTVFASAIFVETLITIVAVRNYLRYKSVSQEEDLILYLDTRIYLIYAIIFLFLIFFKLFFFCDFQYWQKAA